jgi:hypothetical protein
MKLLLLITFFSLMILALVEVHSVARVDNKNVGISYKSTFIERIQLTSITSGKERPKDEK